MDNIKQAVIPVEKLEEWDQYLRASKLNDDPVVYVEMVADEIQQAINSAEEVEPHAYTWIDDGKGSTQDLPLYLHPACKPQPEEYWWCAHCKDEVDSSRVTFSEHHDTCGHHVEWITHRPAPLTELLSDQEIEGIFKRFVRKFYNAWGYEELLHSNDLVDFTRAIERKIMEKNK